MLNDKVRYYLDRLQLEDLCISIDGATKETFEKIRRGASFEQVLENLNYFAEYCRTKGVNLRILPCGLAANWRELPDIFLLARRLGGSVWMNIVQRSPTRDPNLPVSTLEMPAWEQEEAVTYLQKRYEDIKDRLDRESRANYQVHLNSIGGPIVEHRVSTGERDGAW